jgi:AraC-like DNA-binding protein
MSDDGRLYEPAAISRPNLKPLWHVDAGRMLFAGCLHQNALHSHSAPVLLAGLYDDFSLRLDGGTWFNCRAAIVRAGMKYEFDAGGRPLAVVYVEPNEASAEGLAALIRETREERGALIAMRSDLSSIRSLYEDVDSPRWVGEALAELIGYAKAKARRDIDARVRRAIDSVTAQTGSFETTRHSKVDLAARAAGLSTSRFQHLFKQEVGVSYRRYVAWARMREAVSEVVRGKNFTTAAHAAGFYDQPHFSREFRRIFGAPAGRSLANTR